MLGAMKSLAISVLLVLAVRLPALESLWTYPTGGRILSSPVLGVDDTLFALSEDRYVYAFKIDGTALWRHHLNMRPSSSLSVGPDGSIYTVGRPGVLVSIQPSGNENWRFTLDFQPLGDPIASSNGLVYIGGADKLYALSYRGNLVFAKDLPSEITVPPIFDRGKLFAADADGVLYGLNAAGDLLWSRQSQGSFSALAIDRAGYLWAGTREGYIYRYDDEGGLILSLQAPVPIEYLVIDDGRITVGGGRALLTLGLTGDLLWHAVFLDGLADLVLGADHRVYAVTKGGDIAEYDARGARTALHDLGGKAGPLVYHPDGQAFVAGRDWRVYAIAGLEPSNAPWPRQSGDQFNRRIGRDSSVLPWEDIYSGDPQFLYLDSLLDAGGRENFETVLAELRRLASREEPPQYCTYFASRIVSVGTYRTIVGERDHFALVRAEAYDLLGKFRGYGSLRELVDALYYEWEPYALSRAIRALGELGSDPDGSTVRTVHAFLTSGDPRYRDPRVVWESLGLVESVIRYHGTIRNPWEFGVLMTVFSGDFGRESRRRALEILENHDH
jgi:outer membrane protein assembly factor BamB